MTKTITKHQIRLSLYYETMRGLGYANPESTLQVSSGVNGRRYTIYNVIGITTFSMSGKEFEVFCYGIAVGKINNECHD